jgi:hypothetical protein
LVGEEDWAGLKLVWRARPFRDIRNVRYAPKADIRLEQPKRSLASALANRFRPMELYFAGDAFEAVQADWNATHLEKCHDTGKHFPLPACRGSDKSDRHDMERTISALTHNRENARLAPFSLKHEEGPATSATGPSSHHKVAVLATAVAARVLLITIVSARRTHVVAQLTQLIFNILSVEPSAPLLGVRLEADLLQAA